VAQRMTDGERRFGKRLVAVALVLFILALVLAATMRSWVLLCVAASLGLSATGTAVALRQHRRTG